MQSEIKSRSVMKTIMTGDGMDDKDMRGSKFAIKRVNFYCMGLCANHIIIFYNVTICRSNNVQFRLET
jgi:hypothetical protein